MTFAIRGVVEGFYGRLWSWEERRRVVEAIGRAGFDTYAYAPKEDRLQNGAWRMPYPAGECPRQRKLASLCETYGMQLWAGMRPLGFSYADGEDLALLVAKLREALDIGAHRLLLLADDIPPVVDDGAAGRFASLADAHVWLVTEVLRHLDLAPGRMIFVPTDYHGSGSAYLERVGEGLPVEVDVCWTGSGVFASAITSAEAQEIAKVLRRQPLIWDNYPVNDEHELHDLRIGAFRGRGADLNGVVRGFLVNPALEPEAGLVPLLTWAEYLADPSVYDPEGAWRRALTTVAGNRADADATAVIAAAMDRSVIDQRWQRPPPDALRAAIQRVGRFRNRRLAADLGTFVTV